jgi:pimeloyl-ACP methyl ester carboxylesterase
MAGSAAATGIGLATSDAKQLFTRYLSRPLAASALPENEGPNGAERRLDMSAQIREGSVRANGISFATLEAGDGPLVLLLHGFPDNAWTWEYQLPVLAREGYRAVAPFLRGYAPSEVPSGGLDPEDITSDLAALVGALGESSARVVGHDWGGLATLSAAALHPRLIDRAVSIAAGHPRTLANIFSAPEQLHYAFHVWVFQLDGFAELALRANNLALVDYLWRHWSSQAPDPAHLARVRKTLSEPGVVEALISYYRHLVLLRKEKPHFFEESRKNITVPTLIVYGEDDPARAVSESERPFFDGQYRREIVPGAGHFVHREQPAQLTRLLLEHLAAA